MSAMTPGEQVLFARHLRDHLPKPEGAKWHPVHAFTEYAAKALGRRVEFWRDLSKADGRVVMQAASREYGSAQP